MPSGPEREQAKRTIGLEIPDELKNLDPNKQRINYSFALNGTIFLVNDLPVVLDKDGKILLSPEIGNWLDNITFQINHPKAYRLSQMLLED